MKDINNVTLSGRLTRDSELKYTQSGMAIAKFSVASNKTKKVGDNWEEVPMFFDCTVFGKFAEAVQQKLVKGAQVFISGTLNYESWEHEGQKRSKVSVNVDNIQIAAKNATTGHQDRQGPPQREVKETYSDDFEDDIPF